MTKGVQGRRGLSWLRVHCLLYLVLVGGLILTQGCGFHLRGAIDLPEHLQAIKVEGRGPVAAEIRQAIRETHVKLVSDPAEATAVLHILKEKQSRRVLSVDSDGRVNEFELHYSVTFRLTDPAGKDLLGKLTERQTRDYLFNPDDVLGKEAEEQTLRADMRRQLARQVLSRLAYTRPAAP